MEAIVGGWVFSSPYVMAKHGPSDAVAPGVDDRMMVLLRMGVATYCMPSTMHFGTARMHFGL